MQQRIPAGQWWKVHMLQCHHKLCWNERSGHKGVPKIGWYHSQSENKLPKFQYEKTLFLMYISMWSPLGEARSTEIKYNIPWFKNWKLLLHQDTKMQKKKKSAWVWCPKAERFIMKERQNEQWHVSWSESWQWTCILEKWKPEKTYVLIISEVQIWIRYYWLI